MTTTTTAPSTASVTASAAQSLLTSLGSGSGVDTASLVTSLVQAQFATKTAQLKAQGETLTAQISAATSLKTMVADFADAVATLTKSGSLQSQPVVSNPAVLSATATGTASLAGVTASIAVERLAAQQTAVTRTAFPSSSATVGTGTLTLRLGTASFDAAGAMTGFTQGSGDAVEIAIDDTNSSLAGIAAAINAKKAGVIASVVTDADGTAFLSLKGATGAAQAFTLEATSATGDLSQVAVGVGAGATAITGQAANARVSVDGVTVERAGNEITDLVPGLKLTLTATSTTPVSLTTARPSAALTNAVSDFVATYNGVVAAVKEQTDPITGPLRADPAARTLLQSLAALVSRTLLPGASEGTPATLSGLGVRTNRDGTLEVGADTLAAAVAAYPDQVEAMFAPAGVGAAGLASAMSSLKLNATSTLYGLGASTTRYSEAQGRLADQQEAIDTRSESMTKRLTQQFASMNARVAAYKSTQSYLKQQVDAWTKSGD